MLKYGCVVQDTLEGKSRKIYGLKIAVVQQLTDSSAGGGRLLQPMAREAVTQHQVGHVGVAADDAVLGAKVTMISRESTHDYISHMHNIVNEVHVIIEELHTNVRTWSNVLYS